MGSSFDKTRQRISRKRGNINALHEKSRDSKKLHRALVRDEKMEKIASARRKIEQPRIERAAFFQEVVRCNDLKPLETSTIKAKVEEFVHRHDEEYDSLHKGRRPGRPPSAREHLLKNKIAELKQEQQNGFFLPDLSTEDNVERLDRWEGSWAYLSTLAWIKVSKDGAVKDVPWSQDK